MKKAKVKLRKQIPVKIKHTQETVKINLTASSTSLGCVYLEFNGKILRQWELKLEGDNLKTVRVK